MSNTSETPNMLLVLPEPTVEIGPAWASEINTAFGLVDSHDHTNNEGVRVPTLGLNINADLTFNGFNAIGLRTARFIAQTGQPSGTNDLNIAYSFNGELYWRDAAGNYVQITNNGSISGATGSISGLVPPASASYSAITHTFSFLQDANEPGKLVISDINLYENGNPSANPITLISPASLAAPYTFTFPSALPAGSQALVMSSSGVVNPELITDAQIDPFSLTTASIAANTITGNNIATATITSNNIAADTVSYANRQTRVNPGTTATVGEIASRNAGPTSIGLSTVSIYPGGITLSTTGGLIKIEVHSSDTVTAFLYCPGTSEILFQLLRNGTVIRSQAFLGTSVGIPASSLSFIDVATAGTYTYELTASASGASGTVVAGDTIMLAYEL